MIEIPHGCTNVIYHPSCQQYIDKIVFIGLIAGGTGRKEGGQACYFSAAHPQQYKAVPDQKSWDSQLVPCVHHKWLTDTVYEMALVKTQEMGLTFYHTFSCVVVLVGDFQQNVLQESYERPSEVAPHARAIQADVRVDGRSLDSDQQKRIDREH